MARPSDNSLPYYNQDTKDDDNLQYVEAVHGLAGYAIVHKLWKQIYGSPTGYYCAWTAINRGLFCKNNGVTLEQLDKILDTCFETEINIFSKEMFDTHKILTGKGVQKRWSRIVIESGRKNNIILEEYRLIEQKFKPVKGGETPPPPEFPGGDSGDDRGENYTSGDVSGGIIGGETPQSKVKESRVKKSNLKNRLPDSNIPKTPLAPGNPAPSGGGNEGRKKNEPVPEPFWASLVQVYSDFVKEKFGETPLFAGQDPKFFKSIIVKLKQRAAQKKADWNESTAPDRLRLFLQWAFADDWLAKHFILKNLDSKFEEIGRDPKKITQAVQQQPTPCSETDLEYLYGRYLEGDLNPNVVTTAHFDFLHLKKKLELQEDDFIAARIYRVEKLTGTNMAAELRLIEGYQSGKSPEESPEVKADLPKMTAAAKRFATLAYFSHRQKEHVASLFS